MCRIFFAKSDNHQVAGASAEDRRLMKRKDDCIDILEDGVSGGAKGEVNFTIIELPGVSIADMDYLKAPIIVTSRITDRRRKTTDLATLRSAMSIEDKKKFDGHGDYSVNPVTGLREVPQMSKTTFEAQVRDR